MKYILFLFCCALTAARPTTTALRTGKDTAIFFANEIYPNGWDRLQFPVTDATKIAAELHDHYGFDTKIYQNKTREEILNILSEYQRKNYAPDDQLLVFFTGHGYYDQLCAGYYVPKDGRANDPGGASYLEWNSIQSRLSASNCQHILLMADACFAGTADLEKTCPDLFGPSKGPREPVRTETGSERDQFIRATLRDRSRLYFAAAGAVTTNDRSEFARIFLDALQKDYDRNGILDMATLRKRLKIAQPQPQFSSFGGNQDAEAFLFIRPEQTTKTTDRDGDGVSDTADKCPDTWGSRADGCPIDTLKSDGDLAGDLAAWKEAKRLNTALAYREYLRRFPNGEFKDPANTALRKLETDALLQRDDIAWEVATEKNTTESYQKYLTEWPDGRHAEDARKQSNALKRPDFMIFVKGGSFSMGSPDTETDRRDNETQHTVTVSDFYLGKYEVTVADFKAFVEDTNYKTDAEKENYSWKYTDKWEKMEGVNWRHDAEGKLRSEKDHNHPVIHVSWNDATEYCKWLSQKTGKKYRLPTEAEWEYAAGNGVKHTKYSWGNGDPTGKQGGNVSDETAKSKFSTWTIFPGYTDGYVFTAPVGSYNANELGLYDMTGNVWEWCSDWYGSDYYKNSPASNPTGPASGSYRVLRGGSWSGVPRLCRVAVRDFNSPGGRNDCSGFRLARTN